MTSLDLIKSFERNDILEVKRILQNNSRIARTARTDVLDINIQNDDGRTPLHFACRGGHYKIVRLLISRATAKASVLDVPKTLAINIRDKYGYTPLHMAASNARIPEVVKIVKLLLRRSRTDVLVEPLDINAQDNQGHTPLHLLCMSGLLEVTKLISVLLRKGAKTTPTINVNIQNNDGQTPLQYASCDHGNPQIVRLLLARGAAVNIQDEEGNTSLHDASHNGHLEVVKLLLENGANKGIRNNNGNTPMELTTNKDILDVFSNYCTIKAAI